MFDEIEIEIENSETNQPIGLQPPKSYGTIQQWAKTFNRDSDRKTEELGDQLLKKFSNLFEEMEEEFNKSHDTIKLHINDLKIESIKKEEELHCLNEKIEELKSEAPKEHTEIFIKDEDVIIKLKEEILQLKKENVHLKEDNIQLEEKNSQLKKEITTLQSQIKYLWNLIISYITKQLSSLSKSWNSFFRKSIDSTNSNPDEKSSNTLKM